MNSKIQAKICSLCLAVFLLLLSSLCGAQELVKAARADGAETPLMIYSAAGNSVNCSLLAVISPGAGATERTYSYLAKGLSAEGWLAIVMGHKESGPGALTLDVLKAGVHGGMMRMVTDAALHRDRLMDVSAALDWAGKHCNHPYKVLLGHSMGSSTVLFEAGARNKLGVEDGKDRFDAYVAISPSGVGSIFPKGAWSGIHKPVYVLTGTKDKGLEGPWGWRASVYDGLPSGCKWLGVIDDATHMNFGGVGFAKTTKQLTLSTLNAFLNGARAGNCALPPIPPGMTLKNK